MSIVKEAFGKTAEGREVFLYTLTNKHNLTAKITNYGGILTSLLVPDKKGNIDDIVLGFDNLKDYLSGHPYFGALIGRFGNRIAKGRFVLNGKEYKLAVNDGENHLHGGIKGFDKVIWDAEEVKDKNCAGLKLTYLSRDMEEGYPGNLTCVVNYLLTDDNELSIDYEAKTDKPTVVNLTHHSYFNLAGAGNGDIMDHLMKIQADKIAAVGKGLIPTGELTDVKDSAMDFTKEKSIGSRIKEVEGGYDHNFVLNRKGSKISLAAKVTDPKSGRTMEVYTTEPGLQFYSGNFLDGSIKGKGGNAYGKYAGFCLEAQHFPDAPNQQNFTSTVLNPDEKYKQQTIYKFKK